jgi:uncharacterized membrane protein (DUF4010 family)
VLLKLAAALGVGLLLGAERERRKREQEAPAAAGIRTFAVAALAGALGQLLGGAPVLIVVLAAVAAFTALGYWRTRGANDPGLTTEIALVVTVLLGALAVREPVVAGAGAVAVAIVLAARTQLHHFVGSVLSEAEVRSALIFAAATLIVLPLLPDRGMGPYEVLNPRALWTVVVLVMAIGCAGHVAVRAFGARYGLPAAGLAAGFVSSTATIGAMGQRAKKSPELRAGAVAGAVLSTVATVLLLAIVVGAISPATLRALAGPLLAAGIAAVAYGAVFTAVGLRRNPDQEPDLGQAFSLKTALLFGAVLAAVLLAAAALQAWFGGAGALAAAAVAGFADTHASAVSMAALVSRGRIAAAEAVLPVLLGFSTNMMSKIVFAVVAGGPGFAVRVVPGLLLVAIAAWLGALPHLG